MNFFEPDNLCRTTGGRWLHRPEGPIELEGVGIDSRLSLAGKAFVAIRGERYDGHDFAAEAARGVGGVGGVGGFPGARLLIVERAEVARGVPRDVAVLVVDDTRRALGRMAHAYRRWWRATRVIAVTGSAGKTTVKTLIDAVLATTMSGGQAPKSFNNDIGVPLSILGNRPENAYLVLEIGANSPGEIDHLAGIAQPDVGVITMIGRAHLQGFGSLERVAHEKAALLGHLRAGYLAVVNADQPLLRRHLAGLKSVVTFGRAADADLRLTRRGRGGEGWWFEVNGTRRFRLGLPGRHNAVNALSAVAVGEHLGASDQAIDGALAACRPVAMRMSRHSIGPVVLYNDAYNANPDSVAAALETFAELAADARRRIIVFGEMRELGEAAPSLHKKVGGDVLRTDRRARIDHLVLVGPLAAHVAEPMGWSADRITFLDSLTSETAQAVAERLEPGDAVLLKGSRAMGLERIAEAMKERYELGVVG